MDRLVARRSLLKSDLAQLKKSRNPRPRNKVTTLGGKSTTVTLTVIIACAVIAIAVIIVIVVTIATLSLMNHQKN